MTNTTFTPDDVQTIAGLAQIPVTDEEKKKLAEGFTTTIAVVEELNKVDVSQVTPTHQVTNLENVYREDVVDESRMFTQEQALANAPRKHDGFFVVNQVIDQD